MGPAATLSDVFSDLVVQVILNKTVIHSQFWAYESWNSMFPISMSSNCKLMSPKHYF